MYLCSKKMKRMRRFSSTARRGKPTFINRLMATVAVLVTVACSSNDAVEVNAQTATDMGKTLAVYYSFTNNVRTVVSELSKQISADVVEVQPAEEGLDYAADNYAIGSSLIAAIRNNPDDAASYPAIKPTDVDVSQYDNIIVATPLWWSQMAAPMQTFLFQNGTKMAGKHVALIVSSYSSGISSVVADAQRLVPDATWTGDALWINNSNRSQTATLLTEWLANQNFQTSTKATKMYITIDGQTRGVTLADTQAAQELASKLQDGPITVTLNDNGGFEIWGSLGFSLTSSNQQMTAQPGDVILYSGSNICIFYGSNSWSYTRLGKIDGLSADELRTFLKGGQSNIAVTLSLSSNTTGINAIRSNEADGAYYSLGGQRIANPSNGIFIKNGKKVIL